MSGEKPRVDQIVQGLLDKGGSKQERMNLLRELVCRGADLPEEMLDSAIQKLIQRLAE